MISCVVLLLLVYLFLFVLSAIARVKKKKNTKKKARRRRRRNYFNKMSFERNVDCLLNVFARFRCMCGGCMRVLYLCVCSSTRLLFVFVLMCWCVEHIPHYSSKRHTVIYTNGTKSDRKMLYHFSPSLRALLSNNNTVCVDFVFFFNFFYSSFSTCSLVFHIFKLWRHHRA